MSALAEIDDAAARSRSFRLRRRAYGFRVEADEIQARLHFGWRLADDAEIFDAAGDGSAIMLPPDGGDHASRHS